MEQESTVLMNIVFYKKGNELRELRHIGRQIISDGPAQVVLVDWNTEFPWLKEGPKALGLYEGGRA